MEIELTNHDLPALIDEEDFELISKYSWYATTRGRYQNELVVATSINRYTKIMMHRMILDAPGDILVDHQNHNLFDNRRNNIRLCTASQNNMNSKKRSNTSSQYKGVCWDSNRNKWISYINHNYNRINLGRFDNEEEAARAYDKSASKLFGEFALLNFVSPSKG